MSYSADHIFRINKTFVLIYEITERKIRNITPSRSLSAS